MIELQIDSVEGPWIGNDYGGEQKEPEKNQPYVVMSKVTIGRRTLALVFMTRMNINFDGSPKAYGPPNWQKAGLKEEPQDTLLNAGQGSGYYGLVAVHPKDRRSNTGVIAPAHVKFDEEQPDRLGRCPVYQLEGATKGYYVSASARSTGFPDRFDQRRYVNSHAVAFHALSYRFGLEGVNGHDFGLALRHDTYRTASYDIMAGEGHKEGSGKYEWSVGECSYRVFLNIGGQPKPRGARYANNNFQTTFVVFPGSPRSALPLISLASNSYDFAVFLAMFAEADQNKRGSSPFPAYRKYVSGGRTSAPAATQRIRNVLAPYGYAPVLSVLGAVL
jgi:hypothetical protein